MLHATTTDDGLRIGMRVQLHAATSRWMMGDRYGEIIGRGRMRDYVDSVTGDIVKASPVRVRLDKSGDIVRLHPEAVFPVE